MMKMEAFEWVRGEEISRGSSASVSKATVVNAPQDTDLPKLVAVKTCRDWLSGPLREEKRILDEVGVSPHIIRCYGAGLTVENGQSFYNIFLELASGGTLKDELERRRGFKLPESDVKRHARAVLAGLSAIHAKRAVHCDIKPQNILICDGGEAKISDFGLAKKGKCGLRGTPIYIAPEAVRTKECAPPGDVWALGCVVAEMVSGKEPWDEVASEDVCTILKHIGKDDSAPCIPEDMSEDGRDFLRKCFMKDPKARWTAKMLLNHPFVDIPARAFSEAEGKNSLGFSKKTVELKTCKLAASESLSC